MSSGHHEVVYFCYHPAFWRRRVGTSGAKSVRQSARRRSPGRRQALCPTQIQGPRHQAHAVGHNPLRHHSKLVRRRLFNGPTQREDLRVDGREAAHSRARPRALLLPAGPRRALGAEERHGRQPRGPGRLSRRLRQRAPRNHPHVPAR